MPGIFSQYFSPSISRWLVSESKLHVFPSYLSLENSLSSKVCKLKYPFFFVFLRNIFYTSVLCLKIPSSFLKQRFTQVSLTISLWLLPFSVLGQKDGHLQMSGHQPYPDLSLPSPSRDSSNLLPEGEKKNLIFSQLIVSDFLSWKQNR